MNKKEHATCTITMTIPTGDKLKPIKTVSVTHDCMSLECNICSIGDMLEYDYHRLYKKLIECK